MVLDLDLYGSSLRPKAMRPYTGPTNQLTRTDQPGKVGKNPLSERARLARLIPLLPLLAVGPGEKGGGASLTRELSEHCMMRLAVGEGEVHHSFPIGIVVISISPDSCSL